MKDFHGDGTHGKGRHGTEPALQIICLASGGGPSEDNVSGFLVRSTSTHWAKGSVLAVDAGSHLAAITNLLEPHFPRVSQQKLLKVDLPRNGLLIRTDSEGCDEGDSCSDCSNETTPEPHMTRLSTGPFAGLSLPHESARANALHIVRECVATYLITHPHLDHLCAFAINTAAFHNTSRPKRLAALPSTILAIKTHIFNDIIWPNLTDEDGGVGFVTFQRLVQGGNIAVGEGYGKGYIEVCEGLCVKGMKVSHGHCTRGPDATPHRGSDVGLSEATMPRTSNHSVSEKHADKSTRRTPSLTQLSQPSTPALTAPMSGTTSATPADPQYREVVVDSTVYFIRDDHSGIEILFFGDVEPDALSLSPRNFAVWTEAAPKVASGSLKAVVIECSYDDSQGDAVLFGHLAPRWLVRELNVLAGMVGDRRKEIEDRKNSRHKRRRKMGTEGSAESGHATGREEDDDYAFGNWKRKSKKHVREMSSASPKHTPAEPVEDLSNLQTLDPSGHLLGSPARPTTTMPLGPPSDLSIPPSGPLTGSPSTKQPAAEPPLAGLKVIVIHIKDTLKDGPQVGETILKQLQEHEQRLKEIDGLGLGCKFAISSVGESYWI